jgi:hypothetical protein
MKSLQNTIRKNLLEVKNTKKNEMIDSKIVENRFNKIVRRKKTEKNRITKKSYQRKFDGFD